MKKTQGSWYSQERARPTLIHTGHLACITETRQPIQIRESKIKWFKKKTTTHTHTELIAVKQKSIKSEKNKSDLTVTEMHGKIFAFVCDCYLQYGVPCLCLQPLNPDKPVTWPAPEHRSQYKLGPIQCLNLKTNDKSSVILNLNNSQMKRLRIFPECVLLYCKEWLI